MLRHVACALVRRDLRRVHNDRVQAIVFRGVHDNRVQVVEVGLGENRSTMVHEARFAIVLHRNQQQYNKFSVSAHSNISHARPNEE